MSAALKTVADGITRLHRVAEAQEPTVRPTKRPLGYQVVGPQTQMNLDDYDHGFYDVAYINGLAVDYLMGRAS